MLGRWFSNRSPTSMLYALLALTIACVLALCAVPRALIPEEPPALVLDAAPVAAVLAADSRAQALAPDSELSRELDRRFLELGEAEDAGEDAQRLRLRRQVLARTYKRLLGEAGPEACVALRARAVERLEAALALRLPSDQAKRVLGIFPEALRDHSVTRAGEEVAPHFVMRTLYKARWNMAMGLPPDETFAAVEKRAFHGWLALHADHLSPDSRSASLRLYAQAGGLRVAESQGVLAFIGQDFKSAAGLLTQAYRESLSLRLRNWQRGAEVALKMTTGQP